MYEYWKLFVIEVNKNWSYLRRLCVCAIAYPHVRRFYRSYGVVAGRSVVLDCRAWGWPHPNVSWYRGHQELTSDKDPRVSLPEADGRPRGSRLTIDGVEKTDRAYYTCVAWSDQWGGILRQHNATVLVRVKGNKIHSWFYVNYY